MTLPAGPPDRGDPQHRGHPVHQRDPAVLHGAGVRGGDEVRPVRHAAGWVK